MKDYDSLYNSSKITFLSLWLSLKETMMKVGSRSKRLHAKKGAFTWFNLIAESVLLGQASSVVYGIADIFQVFAPRNHSVERLSG